MGAIEVQVQFLTYTVGALLILFAIAYMYRNKKANFAVLIGIPVSAIIAVSFISAVGQTIASAIVTPALGGTGIANNNAETITMSGDSPLTLTLTGATNVTLPTTGTLSTVAGAEALTAKTGYNGLVITPNTGVITSGTWQGTAVSSTYGGTGLNSSSGNGIPSVNSGTWTLNNVLTNTRVLYAGAGNTVTSDGDLTFDGTRLTSSLRARGEPFFDVKAYGAVGDGVTDDTAAIQAAFDALEAADGGIAWFRTVTYVYTANLTITGTAGNYLNGVIVTGQNATLAQGGDLTGFDCLDIEYSDRAVVRDLHFDGLNNAATNCNGMVIHFNAGTTNIAAINLTFTDHLGGMPIDHSGSGRGIIYGNFIGANNENGILQSSTSGSAIIANNYVQANAAGNAIGSIEFTGDDTVVTGNIIYLPASDFGIHADGERYTITGNEIRGAGSANGSAVRLNTGANTGTISGNVFYNVQYGVSATGAVSGVQVSGNVENTISALALTTNMSNFLIQGVNASGAFSNNSSGTTTLSTGGTARVTLGGGTVDIATGNQLRTVDDGSAGAPIIGRDETADGLFFGAGFVGLACSGVECLRANTTTVSTSKIVSTTNATAATCCSTGAVTASGGFAGASAAFTTLGVGVSPEANVDFISGSGASATPGKFVGGNTSTIPQLTISNNQTAQTNKFLTIASLRYDNTGSGGGSTRQTTLIGADNRATFNAIYVGGGINGSQSAASEINLATGACCDTATGTVRWTVDANGILQSNGAQTIQSSTGNLTIATAAGNGNIVLTPNGSGRVQLLNISTQSNCSSSAAPAVCVGAPAGSVVIAAAGTTVTVNTTAVTANSQIMIQEDSSLGTKLSVTCNTSTGRVYTVTARTAATSFEITASAAPVTNPACLSYVIVN